MINQYVIDFSVPEDKSQAKSERADVTKLKILKDYKFER